ncbi:MAG: phytoene/squalene synthase family protein [Acidobacteriaceae bacterium]
MSVGATRTEIDAAYATCRAIARREAKNFYYAFLALPKHKRNAMCAIYAFMRHADDLSDDETKSHAQRRAELVTWVDAWRRAARGEVTDDPVFRAVVDTQRRFRIDDALLEQLVEGTAMDLQSPDLESADENDAKSALQTYDTFADLYHYCYYVASIVGLVCIRIFGYTDARAEKLAEETGIAFQLTNILRDVREDAERGRVYLPLEDLERFGTTLTEVSALKDGRRLRENQRRLLAEIAHRAETYYASAKQLLPLIDADSRPALRVLVDIYAGLLKRIEARDYDVFTAKVSVPTWKKLSILAGGVTQMGVTRVRASRT